MSKSGQEFQRQQELGAKNNYTRALEDTLKRVLEEHSCRCPLYYGTHEYEDCSVIKAKSLLEQ